MADSTFDCCGDLEIMVGVEGLLYWCFAGTGTNDYPIGGTWNCLGFVTEFSINETTNVKKIPCRYSPVHHTKKGRPEKTFSIGQLYTQYNENIWVIKDDAVDFRLVVNKDGDETSTGTPDVDEVIFIYNAIIETVGLSMPDTDEVTTTADGSYDRVEFKSDSTLYGAVEDYNPNP